MADRLPHVVFDLDDTLFSEVDYTRSALRFIGGLIEDLFGLSDVTHDLIRLFAGGDTNPIGTFWSRSNLPEPAFTEALAAMRAHKPQIALRPGAEKVLSTLDSKSIRWSILTDGRSITQRQKIRALGLTGASGVYISQERKVSKPDIAAFKPIEHDFPNSTRFIYVADNPYKDFVAPNQMGWTTVMLRNDGYNLHPQDIDLPGPEHLAAITVDMIAQVLHHIGIE